MEWNAMRKFIDSLRAGVQAEATMMKDNGEIVHNCAKHVEHVNWGKGDTISEEHAAPDANGNIAWYDVVFEHGVEHRVPTAELNILVSESHKHAVKKAVKEDVEQIDEAEMTHSQLMKKIKDGTHEAMTDIKPHRHVEVRNTRTGKRSMIMVRPDPVKEDMDEFTFEEILDFMVSEDFNQLDELSKKTLGSYIKKAGQHRVRLAGAEKDLDDQESAVSRLKHGSDNDSYKALSGVADKIRKQRNAVSDKSTARAQGISTAVKKLTKEEFEALFTEEVDETIEYKTTEVEVNEADKNYDNYFKAAMKAKGIKHPGELGSDEEKKKFFNKVDAGFKAKNEEVFVEAFMRSDVEDRIDAHKKAGNKISDVVHTSKGGSSYHSFVVTEPSGKRSRHIFHGNVRKMESMSAAPKSKSAHESGEDDDDK